MRRGIGITGQRYDVLTIETKIALKQSLTHNRYPLHFPLALCQRRVTRLIDMHAVATPFPGDTTGGIRYPHQFTHVTPTGGHGHQTDAGANLEGLVFPEKAVGAHQLAQFVRLSSGHVGGYIFQQNAKLIVAQTCQTGTLHQFRLEFPRQFFQQLITRHMTIAVVDHLKMIEVEIKQGMLTLAIQYTLQRAPQMYLELTPVEEAGQTIVTGFLPALQSAQPGDITEHRHRAIDITVGVTHRHCRILNTELQTIASQQPAGTLPLSTGAVTQTTRHRVLLGLLGKLIDHMVDIFQRQSPGFSK